jgi:hypothetical protein
MRVVIGYGKQTASIKETLGFSLRLKKFTEICFRSKAFLTSLAGVPSNPISQRTKRDKRI